MVSGKRETKKDAPIRTRIRKPNPITPQSRWIALNGTKPYWTNDRDPMDRRMYIIKNPCKIAVRNVKHKNRGLLNSVPRGCTGIRREGRKKTLYSRAGSLQRRNDSIIILELNILLFYRILPKMGITGKGKK